MVGLLAGVTIWSGRVASVSQIAHEIGQDLHIKIEVAGSLKQDLVFVEPHGADAKVVLNGLAAALHASIRKDDLGYLMERSKADVRDLHRQRTEERASWIKRRIDSVAKFRKASVGAGAIDTAYFSTINRMAEQINAFTRGKGAMPDPYYPEQVLPSQVLLETLLSRVGFASLAALPSGEAQVFEDDPVGAALALPQHQDALLTFEDAMQPLRSVAMSADNRKSIERMRLGSQVEEWTNLAPVARLRLVEQASENGMVFQLEGFDSVGHQVLSAGFDIGPVDGKQTTKVLLMGLAHKPNLKTVTLSPDALDAVKFAFGDRRSKFPVWFVAPDKQEPFNLFVREALEGLAAETPAEPVIVSVSDSLWSNVRQCVQGDKVNLDGLLATIEQWTPYENISRDGASIWRPKDCEIDEKRRSDRRVLARFASDFFKVKHTDQRSIARLYYQSSVETAPLAGAWAKQAQLGAGLEPIVNCSLGEDFYKVLGAIDDSAWSRLLRGQAVTASEAGVANELKAFLTNAIFLRSEGSPQASDIDRHPIEVLRNGTVEETPLSVRSAESHMLKVWDGAQLEPGWAMPVKQFENIVSIHPEYFSWLGDTPTLTISRTQFEGQFDGKRFRFCTQPITDLSIVLPMNQEVLSHIEGNILPSSEPFSYADIPSEFREAVWKTAYESGLANSKKMRTSQPVRVNSVAPAKSTIPPAR